MATPGPTAPTSSIEIPDSAALVGYVLALADDALVLSHRCGEWVTRAPALEEDVALANIGLDLLGQARALLTYAGQVEGSGRDEDALAYLRTAADYRNSLLCELPNGDFATSMARLLAFSAYQLELYRALGHSRDETLAAIAAKAVKEVAYHLDHASQWVVRLGDGTELSRLRMQTALADVIPHAADLFDPSWVAPTLLDAEIAVDPATLLPAWTAGVDAVLHRAYLDLDVSIVTPEALERNGRRGDHTSALVELLAEMQHLHRSHPGARW